MRCPPPGRQEATQLKDIRNLVAADLAAVDAEIRRQLESDVALVNQVGDYIVGGGGKRLRPLLVVLAAHAAGMKGSSHIQAAALIEFYPHGNAPARRRRGRFRQAPGPRHRQRGLRQPGLGAGRRLPLFARLPDDGRARFAVQDRDHSATSRALVSAVVNSGYFDLVATIGHEHEIRALVDSDRARAVRVIPVGTARRLAAARSAEVQVIVNGDNANTASAGVGYATAIVRGLSAALRAERLGIPPTAPIALQPRVWFNPELRSTIFLVPGLIAFIATFTDVVLTALAIVREKEFGTMEQIRMAPIGTLSYVVGKALPYLLLSFVCSMSILIAGMLVFDMPMRGSWPLLMGVTALFQVAALGFGLFLSTIASSQQFAFQVALITSFLPTIVLSGFIFPIANMPAFLQYVTYIVPARY